MTSDVTLGSVVLDCPDPLALAHFYAGVLGWRVAEENDEWVNVRSPHGGIKLACQRAADYQPPTWPVGPRPQMLHIDFRVESIEEHHDRVVGLGATPHGDKQHDEGGEFQVYLDPAGHPFCLCVYAGA